MIEEKVGPSRAEPTRRRVMVRVRVRVRVRVVFRVKVDAWTWRRLPVDMERGPEKLTAAVAFEPKRLGIG